jgi:hypothetical protein
MLLTTTTAPAPRPQSGIRCVAAVVLVLLAACSANLPDRRPQADQLTGQIRGMPGVVATSDDVADSVAQGLVHFWLDVEVADDVTADQLAAITSRYLDGLRAVDYSGYQTELDVRHGWNVFAVDSGQRPVINGDQVIDQARSWVAMRHEFPGATISFHATITHPPVPAPSPNGGPPGQTPLPDVGHPNAGAIDLADATDYTAVIAAVATLTEKFPELSSGNWTISAGKQHPADIKTSRRLPNPDEIGVWARFNADQSIPHIDVMTINGPLTAPVQISEKTQSRDLNVALQLAGAHLPIVAALPAPVLYTTNNQLQGPLGFYGQATGPVAVTVGGCTPRTYRPAPGEQALIDTYEKCRR